MSAPIITDAARDELEKLLAIVTRDGYASLSIRGAKGAAFWVVVLDDGEDRAWGTDDSLLAALEDVRKQWKAR